MLGASITAISLYGEYITAEAPLGTWGTFFAVPAFDTYRLDRGLGLQKSTSKPTTTTALLHRARSFHLPAELVEHVDHVFQLLELPTPVNSHTILRKSHWKHQRALDESTPTTAPTTAPSTTDDYTALPPAEPYVSPLVLNAVYHIVNNTGSNRVNQAVYGSMKQYASPADLLQFEVSIAGAHDRDLDRA